MKVKVGIAGGAGYTAGELLRVLLGHGKVEISWVMSASHSGEPVHKVHTDLLGETNLRFASKPDFANVEVLFLCMGHGKSAEFINENEVPSNVKIIDLGNDFRLEAPGNEFIYGLPELNASKIKNGSKVANPGCFATAIQLALLPLAAEGLLDEIHVHAVTGSTGAGQALSPTTHYSWRDNNISVYKAFEHQHVAEIRQSLTHLMPSFNKPLNFVPMRGCFTRGILASLYLDCKLSHKEALEIYDRFYASAPFTFISEQDIDIKQVVNTNKCLLNIKKHGNKLHVTSVIDNLGKGASAQAVHNMNLMCGFNETEGLYLKPSGF